MDLLASAVDYSSLRNLIIDSVGVPRKYFYTPDLEFEGIINNKEVIIERHGSIYKLIVDDVIIKGFHSFKECFLCNEIWDEDK